MFNDFIAIGLFTKNFRILSGFYKNILDLSVKTLDPENEFAEFQIGNLTIGLVSEKTAANLFDEKYFYNSNRDAQNFTLTVKVDSIAEIYNKIEVLEQAKIISEPHTTPWGWKLFCFKDPEGYIWEVCETDKV
jgi:uncharacterized glyoxalase superfamily protein PhnB